MAFRNADPFMPWNTWWERDDKDAPWNKPRWRNAPDAPWNLAHCSDAYAEQWYAGYRIGAPYGPVCVAPSREEGPRAGRGVRSVTQRWDLSNDER